MKRTIVSILLGITILFNSSNLFSENTFASTATGNLIQNPSVESATNGMPDSWNMGNWGTNNAVFKYVTNAGNTGSSSLEVDMNAYTNGDAKWYFNTISILPNTSYTYSDYYISNTNTSVYVRYADISGNFTYYNLGTAMASAIWNKFEASFTTPSNTVNVTVFHLISSVGKLQTDDYSLIQGMPLSVNLVNPTPNQVIAGDTTLEVNISEGSVTSVQYQVDGKNYGSLVTNAPYTTILHTPDFTNGVHQIVAVATDNNGIQTTSESVSITVANNVSPSNGNIIQNPSVETVSSDLTLPQGWSTSDWGTNNALFSYPTGSAQDGGKSIRVDMSNYTSGAANWQFDNVSVTAKHRYTFSDYYKSNVESEIDIQYVDAANNVSYVYLATLSASSNWKLFSKTFTVPAGNVKASIVHLIYADGYLQTDNFSLKDTTPYNVALDGIGTGSVVSGNRTVTALITKNSNPISDVSFSIDGTSYGEDVTISPYVMVINSINFTNGYHKLVATATDIQGLAISSSPVYFNVSNTKPLPNSGDIVANYSVETPLYSNTKLPANWTQSGWGTNNAVYKYLNTGHSGKHSLSVSITNYINGDADWVSTPEPVIANQEYQFTDYYKANVNTEVDAEINLADGTTQYQYVGTAFASPGSWNQFVGVVTMPENAISATFVHILYSAGTLTTDDSILAPYNPAPQLPFNRGIVSLTFDDGWQSQYTNALPLLEQYGMNGTTYIISSYLGASGYMTQSEIQAFIDNGSELGSHTVTHPHLTLLQATQLNNELQQSQATLQQTFNIPVTDFASPYGEYNDQVISNIKQYYQSHRSTDVGYNSKNSFDIYNIKVQNVDSKTTPADVANWVDQAAQNKVWLVLVYHEINTNNDLYNTTPTDFEKHLQAIKASGLAVETMNQAINEILPQIGH